MAVRVNYDESGRGAWPTGYKSPPAGELQPGLTAVRATRTGEVGINDLAVHRAVAAIQFQVGMPAAERDGILGPDTAAAIERWQKATGLGADGSFGPRSARAAFEPVARRVCKLVDASHTELERVVVGTVTFESRWDPGAVGSADNTDLGLGQINGVHTLDEETRFDPQQSLPWVARFCQQNLAAMGWNVRDGVAAYNLGQGGARAWIKAGRPDLWTSGARKMRVYIDAVLAGG